MKKSEVTRSRILEGALRAMSRHGYDGASMDRIAREAGVNKSLIYYYFKSKAEIRQTLQDDFLSGIVQLFRHWTSESYDLRDPAQLQHVFDEVFTFQSAHSALLRLVLTESLKEGAGASAVMQLLSQLMGALEQDRVPIAQSLNLAVRPDEDAMQTLVTEFFTLYGPMILFIVLRDSWSEYFSIDSRELETRFAQAMRETHISRHLG